MLKAESGTTHRVWRGRGGERLVGGWYATLRRDPLPWEADRLFPTVGASTPQGLREVLTEQAEFARQSGGDG